MRRTTVRTLPAPVALDADDQALLAQVVGYYHEQLKASTEARAYLASRGLDHPRRTRLFLSERVVSAEVEARKQRRLPPPRRTRGRDAPDVGVAPLGR
jgi:hypothetical protein